MATVNLLVGYAKNGEIAVLGGLNLTPENQADFDGMDAALLADPGCAGIHKLAVEIPDEPTVRPLSTLPPDTASAELATASAAHVDPLGR